MSDASETNIIPTRGLFLPLPLVISLIMAAASVGVAYVFATKAELHAHAKDDGDRIIVLEQTVKHHDEALDKIDRSMQAVEQNIRTMLLEQGVPERRIAVPNHNKER